MPRPDGEDGGAATSAAAKKKRGLGFDEELGDNFLSNWKPGKMDAAVGLDLGDSPPRKSSKKFNLPKFDMDLDIDGGFSSKLASFNLDFSGLSPPRATTVPKEKNSSRAAKQLDLPAAAADPTSDSSALSPPRRRTISKEKDSGQAAKELDLSPPKRSSALRKPSLQLDLSPPKRSSALLTREKDSKELDRSPPKRSAAVLTPTEEKDSNQATKQLDPPPKRTAASKEKDSQVTEHIDLPTAARSLSESSAMVLSPPKRTTVPKEKDSQRRLAKEKDSQGTEPLDLPTAARNLTEFTSKRTTVPKERMQDSSQALDLLASANNAIVVFNPEVEVTERSAASLMDNESISKAEKYSRDLEDMCKMLKQKHDEAKNLLVRALISNNSLLMLRSPMQEEKFQMLRNSVEEVLRHVRRNPSRSDTVEMFFSGSIPEAISTAQRTFKLFVVYISDRSQETIELDGNTWSSSQVVELIRGNAIALKLVADSADASNFSAIYPVSRSPSITVVGYGGVKIWQHEGYITAEELSVKLQQAMDVFKRQMQQPALAAMASLMGASQASTSPMTEDGFPPVHAQAEAGKTPDEQAAVTARGLPLVTVNAQAAAVNKPDEQAAVTARGLPPVTVNAPAAAINKPDEQAAAPEEQAPTVDKLDEQSPGPETRGVLTSFGKEEAVADQNAEATSSSFSPQHGPPVNKRGQAKETSEVQEEPVLGTLNDEEVKECVEVSMLKKTESRDSKVPSKILLQVKLMDGGTIRGEFEPSDDLWTVKGFVDEKQAAGGNSSSSSNYRFAVPFPKRVFSAADYDTPLVDLNLGSRAALILVPAGDSKPLIQRLKPGSPCSGGSSYVGSWLSYLNPLSYLRGSCEDAQPAPLSPTGSGAAGAAPSSPSKSSSSRRRSGWGANIHTLNHDEDDDMFKRGNRYWNGNSTQFGGKDDDKNK